MTTGVHVVWHGSSLEHDPGIGHPESPERLRAILEALRAAEDVLDLTFDEAAAATIDQVVRVHPLEYVDRLRQVAGAGGGAIDADTRMSAGSYEAAMHAAGATIEAVRLSVEGTPAFAAVRPPGHHATAARAMGFCLINNVAVATYEALEGMGLEHVLIVDWDVHHGNGTQAIVEADARVRYVSMHQWPLYPGTGAAGETGVGNVINVPLPGGLPRGRYVAALNEAVDRATDGWTPDLVLISAGFDAMAGDPLAAFTLEPEDYGSWITTWSQIGVPMAMVLEGGYVPSRIAEAAIESVAALIHVS